MNRIIELLSIKNDDNRIVKLLDPDRIQEFTKDFKNKIRI